MTKDAVSRHGAPASIAQPVGEARPQQAEVVTAEEHPKGAMLATVLYLAVVVGAWAYLYFMLLARG